MREIIDGGLCGKGTERRFHIGPFRTEFVGNQRAFYCSHCEGTVEEDQMEDTKGKPPGAQVTADRGSVVPGRSDPLNAQKETKPPESDHRLDASAANGGQGPDVDVEPQPQSANDMAKQFLGGFCYNCVVVTWRGTVLSLSQTFHPQAIAIHLSRATARVIGELFNGNLAEVLNARRQCREAFLDELGKQPVPKQQDMGLTGEGMPSQPLRN